MKNFFYSCFYAYSILFLFLSVCSSMCANTGGILYKAAGKGDLDYVKRLVIQEGADINFRSPTQKTPLIRASIKKRKDIVHFLLTQEDKKTKKRRVDFNAVDERGEGALHKACRRDDLTIVKLLLFVGANPNVRNNEGDTPLHLAAKGRDINIVKILIKKKADLSIMNAQGNTPLHEAARANHKSIVEFLIKSGANPHTKNIYGRAPVDDSKDAVKRLLLGCKGAH